MRIINNKELMQAASPMDFLSAVEKTFLLQKNFPFKLARIKLE